MNLPFVSRKKYAAAVIERRVALADLETAKAEIAADKARIAEMSAPEAATKRSIAEVEAEIRLAELEETLRKIKEEPDAEQKQSGPPSIDTVRKIAADNRARRVPRKT